MTLTTNIESRRRAARNRVVGVICWSGFLAAAFSTMLCFAFVDPQELAEGNPPQWWTTRLHVYALGFFLFWLTGAAAAALAWFLAHPLRRVLRK